MKTITGIVVSNKMDHTVVVEYVLTRVHPLYKKIIRQTRKVKADTKDKLNIGDKVLLKQTRPISREKHYKVIKILNSKL